MTIATNYVLCSSRPSTEAKHEPFCFDPYDKLQLKIITYQAVFKRKFIKTYETYLNFKLVFYRAVLTIMRQQQEQIKDPSQTLGYGFRTYGLTKSAHG